MNVFAIGDLHLSHTSNKPMDVFGEHWTNHMEKIKINWEQKITEEDIVLIPGDISWAMRLNEADIDLRWLDQLPGQKICIRGNHDYWWDRPGQLNRKYPRTYFLQNTVYKLGTIGICGARGWRLGEALDEMAKAEDERLVARECTRLKLSLDAAIKQGVEEIWVMLHYPPCTMEYEVSPFRALIKQYPVTKLIYGHLHGNAAWDGAIIGEQDGVDYQLVSADYLDFKPLCLTNE